MKPFRANLSRQSLAVYHSFNFLKIGKNLSISFLNPNTQFLYFWLNHFAHSIVTPK